MYAAHALGGDNAPATGLEDENTMLSDGCGAVGKSDMVCIPMSSMTSLLKLVCGIYIRNDEVIAEAVKMHECKAYSSIDCSRYDL